MHFSPDRQRGIWLVPKIHKCPSLIPLFALRYIAKNVRTLHKGLYDIPPPRLASRGKREPIHGLWRHLRLEGSALRELASGMSLYLGESRPSLGSLVL